jgi:hypothetical protein
MQRITMLFFIILFLAACSSPRLSVPEQTRPVGTQTIAAPTTPARTQIPAARSGTATLTSAPENTPTPTAVSTPTVDKRLTAYYWREWPTIPEISPHARQILLSALNQSELDLQVFSKVGDCQMTSATFLGGYANGKYPIPEGSQATVRWFSESMATESITAANGLGINSVLNPIFGLAAGYGECDKNETPLDCELRTRRPVVVLIAMGTNWKPAGEISFDKYLRVVVDRVLETGALPILSTKADNVEQDWKLNQVIAQAAYDYDLPLVNVWRSTQDLPNHGLEAPKNIYLTGDGWMRRNQAWLLTLDRVVAILNN